MTAPARGSTTWPRALVLLTLSSASCAAPLVRLPVGPGTPAPDAAEVVTLATAGCRSITSITAEVSVSGSVNGRRLRGRLAAGLASPASARLEAIAPFGPPLFIFVAVGDDATLLLPRDQRVLEHGRPDAVLEAIAGVPLDPPGLMAVVTGCAGSLDAARARGHGENWRVVPDGSDEVYFQRESAALPWRLVATVRQADGSLGWRAEYREFRNGQPTKIRIVSMAQGRFDLKLALSQIDLNTPLGGEVFRVRIPSSAESISLTELRDSGPLGANGR
jgi:hypothetical protein